MIRTRRMNMWKTAIGCLICVILLAPIFFPVFRLSEKDFTLSVIDAMEDCMGDDFYDELREELKSDKDDILSELWNSANSTITDSIKKEVDKEIAKQRKTISKNTELRTYSYSGLRMLTESTDSIAEKMFSKDDNDKAFVGAINKNAREQSVKFINLYKLRVAFMMIGPIVLIAIILFTGLKKKKVILPVAVSGVYALLYLIEQAAWYTVIPTKMADKLNGYMGNMTKNNQLFYELYKQLKEFGLDAKKLTATMKISTDTTKGLLKSFDGVMMNVALVGVVLLVIWMCITLFIKSQEDFVPDEAGNTPVIPNGPIGFDPIHQTNDQTVNPFYPDQNDETQMICQDDDPTIYGETPQINGKQPVTTGMPLTGTDPTGSMVSGEVHYELGELQGAQFSLGLGESITIGRDAFICQLVLSDPLVAQKHCTISMDPSGHFYKITCYTNAGVYVYHNQQSILLGMNQKVRVGRGTKLIFAQDREVITLY